MGTDESGFKYLQAAIGVKRETSNKTEGLMIAGEVTRELEEIGIKEKIRLFAVRNDIGWMLYKYTIDNKSGKDNILLDRYVGSLTDMTANKNGWRGYVRLNSEEKSRLCFIMPYRDNDYSRINFKLSPITQGKSVSKKSKKAETKKNKPLFE